MTDLEGIDALAARLRQLLERAPGPFYLLDQPWLKEGDTSLLVGSPDPHVAKFICNFDDWGDEDGDSEPIDKWAYASLIELALNELPALLTALQSAKAALVEKEGELAAERLACAQQALGLRTVNEALEAMRLRAERAEAELAAVRADALEFRGRMKTLAERALAALPELVRGRVFVDQINRDAAIADNADGRGK